MTSEKVPRKVRGSGLVAGPTAFAIGMGLLVLAVQVVLRPALVDAETSPWIRRGLGSAPSLLFVLGAPFLGMDSSATPRPRSFGLRCTAVVLVALAYEVSQDFRTDRSFDLADCAATGAGGALAYLAYLVARRRRWIRPTE